MALQKPTECDAPERLLPRPLIAEVVCIKRDLAAVRNRFDQQASCKLLERVTSPIQQLLQCKLDQQTCSWTEPACLPIQPVTSPVIFKLPLGSTVPRAKTTLKNETSTRSTSPIKSLVLKTSAFVNTERDEAIRIEANDFKTMLEIVRTDGPTELRGP